ncbi:Formate hydrogenlyase subunit 5 precursor [Blastochloris viridis]|uniref:Formate hydrogenlyase subunit 5 n=3 Tax=Blastochloris viridis TaxID=1079 RepID=A0A0H5BNI8_BLAVI|nr:Formate hydrogenlyase subunit 5 precursor [Blastochloris viridis]BAR97848.1 formate hydrogenlyase subunit 5 [Blastochloris viridis]CUU41513.1 Hydrogenase-3 component E [Blastochloris viridis]
MMDATLLSVFTGMPAAGELPWPRFELLGETEWIAIAEALGRGEGDLVALFGDDAAVHMAVRGPVALPAGSGIVSLPVPERRFPSVGRHHPPAIRLERTIRDLYGHVPVGAVDARPWLDHGVWGGGAAEPYVFLPVEGEGLHQIPVGPVHAGIIEPGHFRFTANGEVVVRLEERLGYVHKGVEALAVGATLDRAARLAGRVSGDSTVAYALAFARAVEAALGLELPPRARLLRGVLAELERIANHIGDLGAVCNDASFALMLTHCGLLREEVLRACDVLTGHRLMMDRVVPGGLAADLTDEGVERIAKLLDVLEPRFERIVELYDLTPSLLDRTVSTGVVRPDYVRRFAAGGPVGRASGRDFDARRDHAYPPYDRVPPRIVLREAGDVDARLWVRIDEVRESIRLVRGFLSALTPGPVTVALRPVGEAREGASVIEAFRGEVFAFVRLRPDLTVDHLHLRDASWFQWPLLETAIEGNIVADFPLINKSFNCSYSGQDL